MVFIIKYFSTIDANIYIKIGYVISSTNWHWKKPISRECSVLIIHQFGIAMDCFFNVIGRTGIVMLMLSSIAMSLQIIVKETTYFL